MFLLFQYLYFSDFFLLALQKAFQKYIPSLLLCYTKNIRTFKRQKLCSIIIWTNWYINQTCFTLNLWSITYFERTCYNDCAVSPIKLFFDLRKRTLRKKSFFTKEIKDSQVKPFIYLCQSNFHTILTGCLFLLLLLFCCCSTDWFSTKEKKRKKSEKNYLT